MAALHHALVALGLLCTVQAEGLNRRHSSSPCPGGYIRNGEPATFYYLVREWPETYCKSHSCSRQPPHKWTIHGLWPNWRKRDGYPHCCADKPRFNRNSINDLVPQLESAWPSLSEPNYEFWAHEYEKHATCNIDRLDELAYFQATLDLNRDYSIEAALGNANIVPSDDLTYARSDLEDALAAAWGQKPVIKCQCPNGNEECDVGTIDVIYTCINKGLSIGDCHVDCTGEGCNTPNCESIRYPTRRRQGSWGAAAGNMTTA